MISGQSLGHSGHHGHGDDDDLLVETIAFAAAMLAALMTDGLAQLFALQPVDERLVACLIGNAGVSLHKQIGTQVNAKAATDAAMTDADK